ncbi:MAG: FMN-binding protein [Erysipelotrichaceae bacterium]|nr:FMN-binding protein [Erysipelotrichaceae bacterium]
MKKLFMILLSCLMAVSVAACSSTPKEEDKIYTAGTYTATAAGFGGDVTVELTVSDTEITDVVITGANETAGIGAKAIEDMAAAMKEGKTIEVDGMSGATITSNAVAAAAKSALDQAMGVAPSKTALTDGTYTATAVSYSWTGMMSGEVTITDGKIADIKITEEHDSETGEIAATALNILPGRIIENQSLATDAVSGATVTSNAIKTIVTDAIEQAGGVASEWMEPVAKSTETVKLEGYDVVVVGLGGSGILSYLAAAEQGATVFGIETAAKLGGNSTTTTGPMLLGSIGEAYNDVTFADKDEVYQVWMDYVESDEKADIIKEAVYNNDTHIKYYVDNFGFEFAGMILSFVRPQWSQFWTSYVAENGVRNIFGPNKTNQYDRAMEKAVELNEKNDYMLELTAEELIFDGDTAVGVKAVKYDGTTYEIYGDSIILATGGYVGNAEMCEEHWGRTLNTVAVTVNDGTGINMGISAGGATYMLGVDPMIHILQIPNMIKNDDLTADQKAILSALALAKGEMSTNVYGEPLDLTLVEAQIPNYLYYNIYSEAEINEFKTNGLTDNFAMATSMFMGQGGKFTVGTPVEDMDTILSVGAEYGNVLKAESIKDLAAQIGCDEATLTATLGEDGVYYAVACAGYTYGSVGGLDVDVNMNVLREDGTPIANLFAVGADSQGVENIEGKVYTPWGGQAQSWTFTSGYLAGHAAAAYGLSK